jgi:hypothetical protein
LEFQLLLTLQAFPFSDVDKYDTICMAISFGNCAQKSIERCQ